MCGPILGHPTGASQEGLLPLLPSPEVPWDRLEAMGPGWLVLPSTHLTLDTESFVEVFLATLGFLIFFFCCPELEATV